MHGSRSAAHRLAQVPRPKFKSGGLILGPGTGTSDSIPANVPEGAYIMPADSTQQLGLAAQALGGGVPVNVSNGEYNLAPEQVQQIGAGVLDILRGVTHQPAADQVADGQSAAEALGNVPSFADGGAVTNDVTRVGNSYSGMNVGGNITVNGQAAQGTFSENPGGAVRMPAPLPSPAAGAPAAPALAPSSAAAAVLASPAAVQPAPPAAPMGWAERNAQRSLEVTASSIAPGQERDNARAQLASQRLGAFNDPRSTLYSTNPNAAGNAARLASFAASQGSRGFMDMGRPQPAVAPTARNSFGDAAAATVDPSVTQQGYMPPARRFADGGLVEDERRRQNSFGDAAAVLGNPGVTLVAAPAPAPAPASNGPLGRAAAVVPVAAPAADVGGSAREMLMAPPRTASAPAPDMGVQTPVVRHSGNDWQSRNELRNLEVSASSITNQPGFRAARQAWSTREPAAGPTPPAVAAYQTALQADQALRTAQPGLDQAGMQERGANARARLADIGNTQRAVLQEQGEGARAVLADAGADRRQALQERGLNLRQLIEARRSGQPPAGYRWTAGGTMEAIPGGPADVKNSKEAVQQGKDTQDIFSIIDQARPLLGSATGSYAGNVVDKVAQTFGVATPGAQAAAQLKALQGALVSKMPKMSGPQSDKDVLLYREMAGQIGDPTIPAEQRRAAMSTIEELNMKYLPVATDATSYQSVPQGSYYRTPGGEIRRKN